MLEALVDLTVSCLSFTVHDLTSTSRLELQDKSCSKAPSETYTVHSSFVPRKKMVFFKTLVAAVAVSAPLAALARERVHTPTDFQWPTTLTAQGMRTLTGMPPGDATGEGMYGHHL